MSATNRRGGLTAAGVDPATVVLWVVLAVVTVAVGAVTAAAHLGHRLAGTGTVLPGNPFELVIGLGTGSIPWPTAATAVAGGIAAVLLAAGGSAGVLVLRWRGRRSRVDRAARHLGRGTDLAALTERGAAGTAARLGVESPGLPVAVTVAGGRTLYSSWEDVSVDIWGPRTGKTTSRAIPAILDAPGAVLATTNKRDLVDATRGPRTAAAAQGGGEVWVFDPQRIVDEPADWWWNPLSYVVDETKAATLAKLFTTAAREPGARTDAYFDTAATALLANLLLAAALAGRPVTQVYLWLTDPTNDEPAAILREHGYPLPAAAVEGIVNAPEKQRGGVYGTGQETVSFLTSRQATRWVTPDSDTPGSTGRGSGARGSGGADRRRQFDPAAFVRSTGTLYSLSKEGEGSTGPLVTALTVAVTEAAEALAKTSPGGRLPVPLVCVLDEAANVCRWHNLPDLYSHYGSRGITILTILQSWSQGVQVWGREGMRKLWSAATIKIYGGGVTETEFLTELSQLTGDHDTPTISTSRGKGGRSTSHTTRRERVLDVADLAALPRGRALLIASGAPPTLVRTLPWMTGPHADAVTASIDAHDPAAERTVAETSPLTQPQVPAQNSWGARA